jgi:predicted ATPase
VVHEIGSAVDYRKLTSAEQGFYFIGKDLSTLLKQKFRQLIGDNVVARPQVVEVVMGRKLQIPLGANGCAYFPFEELCDRPLGAADYFGLFSKILYFVSLSSANLVSKQCFFFFLMLQRSFILLPWTKFQCLGFITVLLHIDSSR